MIIDPGIMTKFIAKILTSQGLILEITNLQRYIKCRKLSFNLPWGYYWFGYYELSLLAQGGPLNENNFYLVLLLSKIQLKLLTP